jgi:hypothetical protein
MPQSLPTDLYLDMMKRCLTDSIFIDHPLAHVVPYQPKRGTPQWKRTVMAGLAGFMSKYQFQIVETADRQTTEQRATAREHGGDWPLRAHTMIGMQRLDNLKFCVESVIRNNIPGDLIETGVWRGGACIFMRAILKAHEDTTRRVWVADSFSGLPPPDAAAYPADVGDKHHSYAELAISREEVEKNFRRYGLLDEQVRFLEGWFKDTLPAAPIQRLAVLRLDGDMYESTIQAIEALYDKLSPGGFVIVDDYHLAPCVQAIQDFRKARGITDPIQDIDGMGSFWLKS